MIDVVEPNTIRTGGTGGDLAHQARPGVALGAPDDLAAWITMNRPGPAGSPLRRPGTSGRFPLFSLACRPFNIHAMLHFRLM
jgi:hypothetical protein